MSDNLGGRPAEITEEWADNIADDLPAMFANGESVAEVAVALGVCKVSFYKATKISPKFLNAYKKGLDQSEAWWSRLGRDGASGEADIQPTTWIFNMKNRFNWVDKKEITGAEGGPVSITTINRTIIKTKDTGENAES